MPIVATAVPKMPAERMNPVSTREDVDRLPRQYEERSAAPIVRAGGPVVSNPTEMPEMMLVAGPVGTPPRSPSPAGSVRWCSTA